MYLNFNGVFINKSSCIGSCRCLISLAVPSYIVIICGAFNVLTNRGRIILKSKLTVYIDYTINFKDNKFEKISAH